MRKLFDKTIGLFSYKRSTFYFEKNSLHKSKYVSTTTLLSTKPQSFLIHRCSTLFNIYSYFPHIILSKKNIARFKVFLNILSVSSGGPKFPIGPVPGALPLFRALGSRVTFLSARPPIWEGQTRQEENLVEGQSVGGWKQNPWFTVGK